MVWPCERRDDLCWLKRIKALQVDSDGVKGRPRKSWREVLKEDMKEKGLCREVAWDRSRWRKMLWVGSFGHVIMPSTIGQSSFVQNSTLSWTYHN